MRNYSGRNQRNHNHGNSLKQIPDKIPSPYNFVPLSKKIVFIDGKDDWGNKISQDIPFKDGLSGCLDIEVTSETPIYIRNGGTWQDKDRKDTTSPMQDFFKLNDQEFLIPGTSFKGMLRNVFEIATFSKINANRIDDKRYSIRDLYNSVYTDKMTHKQQNVVTPLVESGWLHKSEDGIKISKCSFARVDISDLNSIKNINLAEKQSAVTKYSKWGINLTVSFDIHGNDIHDHNCFDCQKHKPRSLKIKYKKAIKVRSGSLEGKNIGQLVFTGQPVQYKGQRHCKHMEFIFYDEDKKDPLDVSLDLFKDFVFIHSDDKKKPNEEWGYWKEKLFKGERVPVFYLTDSEKSLHSMGLAMMYRLPYANSIHQTIEHTNPGHLDKNRMDMAEGVFGYISDNQALKGRVQIGHFMTKELPKHDNRYVKTVLGSPKPTFFPNYLEQSKLKENYFTYMDNDSRIRGWKRYPVESGNVDINSLPKAPNDNEDVATLFRPLPKGSKFEGKIRFHNLKPVELGALLWSLTFGNRKNCKHKIGMAKPLGFGVISVSVKSNDSIDMDFYINDFIEFMNKKLSNIFESTDQIQQLIAMSDTTKKPSYEIRYPILDPQNRRNDFADFKNRNNRKALELYLPSNKP